MISRKLNRWGIALGLLLTACASYRDSAREMQRALYEGSYSQALEKLDKSSVARSSGDQVLYRMERGQILYLSANYTAAVKEWDLAARRIDELYTISISKQAASLAVNESFSDYEGEYHEKILLPVSSALAFMAQGQFEKAAVEARRTYEVMNVLKKDNGEKDSFTKNAFAHYLSGLIYEAREDWDAAIVEYRNALEELETGGWQGNVSAEPFREALGRLAEFRNRGELLASLRKKAPSATWMKHQDLRKMGEAYLVYEAGRAPVKEPSDVLVPIDNGVIRVSFPVLRGAGFSSRGASISLDGRPLGRPTTLLDVGAMARQALNDRRGKDLARLAARVIAKDQASRAAGRQFGPLARVATSIVGAVTETADTRAWTSLPELFQVMRIPVPADRDTRIYVKPDFGRPEEFVVRLRPGEKRLLRLRTFD